MKTAIIFLLLARPAVAEDRQMACQAVQALSNMGKQVASEASEKHKKKAEESGDEKEEDKGKDQSNQALADSAVSGKSADCISHLTNSDPIKMPKEKAPGDQAMPKDWTAENPQDPNSPGRFSQKDRNGVKQHYRTESPKDYQSAYDNYMKNPTAENAKKMMDQMNGLQAYDQATGTWQNWSPAESAIGNHTFRNEVSAMNWRSQPGGQVTTASSFRDPYGSWIQGYSPGISNSVPPVPPGNSAQVAPPDRVAMLDPVEQFERGMMPVPNPGQTRTTSLTQISSRGIQGQVINLQSCTRHLSSIERDYTSCGAAQ